MEAYVSLLYSDAYIDGALVLAQSLLEAGATKTRAILVTRDIAESNVQQLRVSIYNFTFNLAFL